MFYLQRSSLRPPAIRIALLTGRYCIVWPKRELGAFPPVFSVMNSPETTLRSTVTGLKYLSLLLSS